MSARILKAGSSAKPARMWIDGKCFTIRKLKQSSKKAVKKEDDVKIEETAMETDAAEDHGFNITSDENGKLFTSFRLPMVYYKKIATHSNFKVNRLETETNTQISIPAGNNGNLVITGGDITKVIQARHRIHSVIDNIRHSYPAMQFVAIPLISEEIKKNFENFKNEILHDEVIEGMDETIFQSPLKLHLTMTVFSLFDDTEINEAIQTLQDYKGNILKNLITANLEPLKIQVSGLDCMEDNLSKVNVLYANAKIVNETSDFNLQNIANSIANYFYERGLVKKPEDNVKLHCTLINTKYRKSSNQASPKKKSKWPKRQSFDARSIMEKYKDHNFGMCNFDSIHLSLISSKGEDGFYKPLSIVKLDF